MAEMMGERSIPRMVRDFLFSTANKEFLIFLFFLALSVIFWLFMTLDETYEQEVVIPVHIANVPKDIMLTSDDTDTLRVTVRENGTTIFTYLYGDRLQPISANFKTYDQGNGTGIIPTSDLIRLATKRLKASSKVVSIKPERLKFYYSTGQSKRVPVHWSGRVMPEHLYFISQVVYSPDSVTVYAAPDKLDSIKTVLTEPLNYAGFRDTLTVDCQLQKTEGVIPVVGINMPEGKVLRTFPAKVSVHFVTGVSVFRTLKASDFIVVADYNSIKAHPSEKCELTIKKVPSGISRAALVTRYVDYLIEEQGK